MNLPSPDEQLDLHGPRAQLPFEQIPPQARAGVKASHESLEQDSKALIASNGIITSSGPPKDPAQPQQEALVSPDKRRPGWAADHPSSPSSDPAAVKVEPSPPSKDHEASTYQSMADMDPAAGTNEASSTSFLSRLAAPFRRPKAHEPSSPSAAHPQPATTMQHQRRPLKATSDSNHAGGFGTYERGVALDSNEQPPHKLTRFQSFAATFKRFMRFVGPGYTDASILSRLPVCTVPSALPPSLHIVL
ncbi:hypothetical protein BGZ70_004376 [Mortierella alpina]|uniref:Uncharacterized protein n=1 Tax=Mortierella alpina TaxID=64518 RepID=A0A9P6IQX6_MORAP|nr:hypothetical protein BGZ70_004376 [Mortierella alpina]